MRGLAQSRPAPDPATDAPGNQAPVIGLFWRTFMLLVCLILGSTVGLLELFRLFEFEPYIQRNTFQIASVVNLSRNALMHTDLSARASLLSKLAEEEDVYITLRQSDDQIMPFGTTSIEDRLAQAVLLRLGPETLIASEVNGVKGLWVGFDIEQRSYWLQMDVERLHPIEDSAWLIWLGITSALSLAGAVFVARWVNRPLRRLSWAVSRTREGQFHEALLDENDGTRELQQVTRGFNRMVRRLAKAEEDRALMLAGLSHDLRTPLARLRLETELSVPDVHAREAMSADIAQLDDIIGQFLDYGRRGQLQMAPVALADLVQRCMAPLAHSPHMRIECDIDARLEVQADAVELSRAVSNVLENARRYGRSASDGVTHMDISARIEGPRVSLVFRDHGAGVDPALLNQLSQPFVRGDSARSLAQGAGLGLAIVERAMQRMQGRLRLALHPEGGFMATLSLPRPAQ